MHFASPAEIFGVDGIIVLVVVVLVLFGSTQIPKLARSLGSAQKEFKKGLDEGSSEGSKDVEVPVPVRLEVTGVVPGPPSRVATEGVQTGTTASEATR